MTKGHESNELDNETSEHKEFGPFIKDFRTKRDLTLSQVAEKLNISTNYVSQLERGIRRPTDELIRDFSRLYNVNEDRLFRMAGRIPLSTLEEMKQTPSLQKAFSYLNSHEIPNERKKKLEQELLDVFAEFLNVHKEELLKEEISKELTPKDSLTKSENEGES